MLPLESGARWFDLLPIRRFQTPAWRQVSPDHQSGNPSTIYATIPGESTLVWRADRLICSFDLLRSALFI